MFHQEHVSPTHHPEFGKDFLQQHMFYKIPLIQNSLYSMGIRIRGLSMLRIPAQYQISM